MRMSESRGGERWTGRGAFFYSDKLNPALSVKGTETIAERVHPHPPGRETLAVL